MHHMLIIFEGCFPFELHFPFQLIFTAPVIFRLLKKSYDTALSVRPYGRPSDNSRTTTDRDKWTTDIDSACFEYVHKRVSSFCDFSVNSSKNHCIFRSPFACSADTSILFFIDNSADGCEARKQPQNIFCIRCFTLCSYNKMCFIGEKNFMPVFSCPVLVFLGPS